MSNVTDLNTYRATKLAQEHDTERLVRALLRDTRDAAAVFDGLVARDVPDYGREF